MRLSFKRIFYTTYTMSYTSIAHLDSHKDLALVLTEDLSWDKHYINSSLLMITRF